MMTFSELGPSLPIRISRAQLLLLVTSLKALEPAACAQLYHFNGGNVVPWDVLPRNIELFHDPLIRLWKRFTLMATTNQGRYRTRLDAFEASMCGMGLRAVARRERTSSTPINPRQGSRRLDLMRTIENHRRRAIRKFKNTVGAEASAELATKLREYQSLLLTDLFQRWPKYRDNSQSLYKQRINRLVAYATEGLQEATPPIPPANEIRRLVRLFVRYIRRGRYAFRIRELLINKELAMSVLAAFILERWDGEETSKTDIEAYRPQLNDPPRAGQE